MPARRSTKTSSLAIKTAELALAIPQVVAHRVTRMSMAGSQPSTRDQKEFSLMMAEKTAAFTQSWSAMLTQAVLANQALALSLFRSFWLPTGRGLSPATLAAQIRTDAMGVLSKGLAPVHRTAVANAKRLGRTRLR